MSAASPSVAALMADIRALGRVPKEVRGAEGDVAERQLAVRLRRARGHKKLTDEQEAELATLGAAQPDANTNALMNEIRALGRIPRRVRGDGPEVVQERNLAKRLEWAKAHGKLTADEEAQLAEIALRDENNRVVHLGGSTGRFAQTVLDHWAQPTLEEVKSFKRRRTG